MKNNKEFYEELTNNIKDSYESGTTLEEAEKLAGKFLYGQMLVSDQLKSVDLDARMKKIGAKAVKAAVYQQEATKGDKKPSDAFLQSLTDMNDMVQGEQQRLDEAEVNRDYLQNLLGVFKDAHIHFRSIAKGRFE